MLFISFVTFIVSCGSAVNHAQDFKPNEAPVYEGIVIKDTSGNSIKQNEIVIGMELVLTVTAHDPEKTELRYDFTSDAGSFSSKNITDTGCSVNFWVEKASSDTPVTVDLSIKDSKDSSFSTTIDVGTGQTGAQLTLNSPSPSTISTDEYSSFTFSSTADGLYQIVESDTKPDPSKLRLKYYPYTQSYETPPAVIVGGNTYTGQCAVKLTAAENAKKVWVIFQDLNYYTVSEYQTVSVFNGSPSVISHSPSLNETGVSWTPTVTVNFSKSVNPSTLASALSITGGPVTSVTLSSSTAKSAVYAVTGLDPDIVYTATVSGVKDTIGTAAPSYSFTFRTAVMPATSIAMTSSVTVLKTATATVTPAVTPVKAAVSYTNSDSTVADYNSSTGLITAKKAGSTLITVTSVAAPSVKSYCLVSVPEVYTVGSVSFKVLNVPVPTGGITFPSGTADSGTATVTNAFWMAETQVTDELWNTVCTWANSNGYTIDTTYVSTNYDQIPPFWATWKAAAVFCNAITAWINNKTGSNLTFIYTTDGTTPGKTGAEISSITLNTAGTGFRLPTSAEYELAARWRSNTVNTVASYTTYPFFTKGDSASGATANVYDTTATALVSVMNSSTAETVKQKIPNSLGLYDMSGNQHSFCYDSSGSYKVIRGGSMIDKLASLQTGYSSTVLPYGTPSYASFRLVRNK
jgi:formylglycine-generating enzyme required for sulfatase activity